MQAEQRISTPRRSQSPVPPPAADAVSNCRCRRCPKGRFWPQRSEIGGMAAQAVMTPLPAALLSLPVAVWLGSSFAFSQSAERTQQYEARPGDSVQYRVRRQGDGEATTCWRAFAGKTGKQVTAKVTCDNGFRGTSILDLSGGLVHDETRAGSFDYKPHNRNLPTEPPRVGLSWSGTYQVIKNGRPHGWASKDCSVTAANPYKLQGFPETLTAYSIECSFGRTSDSKLGTIRYTVAYIGNSWPVTVKFGRGKAIRFSPHTPRT